MGSSRILTKGVLLLDMVEGLKVFENCFKSWWIINEKPKKLAIRIIFSKYFPRDQLFEKKLGARSWVLKAFLTG